jgi:hypothetical protein
VYCIPVFGGGQAEISPGVLHFLAIARYDEPVGIRGEIFSTRVMLNNRSYFFNIKENRSGDVYFNIVESKNRECSGFERQSVIVFDEDLQEFLKGFDEALKVFEKTVRDRKKSKPAAYRPPPRTAVGNENVQEIGKKPAVGKKILIAGKKRTADNDES